jgi:protein-S-isoprenylcysteine O-methyltransferase Ste14
MEEKICATVMPESRRLAWFLVGSQILLMLVLLLAPAVGVLWTPAFLLKLTGWILVAGGLAIAAAASWQLHGSAALSPLPHPRTNSGLVVGGLYRWVRHPVYGGLLLWAAGLILQQGSLLHLLAGAALWLVFSAKAGREERLLEQQFPDYREKMAAKPRFFPLGSGA